MARAIAVRRDAARVQHDFALPELLDEMRIVRGDDHGDAHFLKTLEHAHHFDRKPWVARLRSNVYSRLLTRLLLAPDVPIRLPAEQLPPRLRTGAAADAARLGTDALMAFPGAARRLRERFGATPDDPITSP